ncbi:hypothetical protein G4B88_019464 [Cannabis sativa]|uniref:Uncharacterized protein n=1 Tax=Cannabis sativa TaxID=3483 RepID=A0A7J6HZ50_CANSA|nr:hypothetical protein G4B88_019464 [Cannabis sativa]
MIADAFHCKEFSFFIDGASVLQSSSACFNNKNQNFPSVCTFSVRIGNGTQKKSKNNPVGGVTVSSQCNVPLILVSASKWRAILQSYFSRVKKKCLKIGAEEKDWECIKWSIGEHLGLGATNLGVLSLEAPAFSIVMEFSTSNGCSIVVVQS